MQKLVREGEKFFVELGGYRVELDAEKEARLLAKDVQSQEVTLGVQSPRAYRPSARPA